MAHHINGNGARPPDQAHPAEDDIIFETHAVRDQTPIEGHAIEHDDPQNVKAYERGLKERIARNPADVWAWCIVVVTARWNAFTGIAIDGQISCANQQEFEQSEDYRELRQSAYHDLLRKLGDR